MKFISKYSNYRVVLRPGVPGNRAIGIQPTPGLYVKFEGGIAEVNKDEHIKLMLEHPAFGEGRDFISATDDGIDPYVASRAETEPVHSIAQIKYGQVEGAQNKKPDTKFTASQLEAIKKTSSELAINMLKEMLPTAVENEIKRRAGLIEEEEVLAPKNKKIMAPEPIEDEDPIEAEEDLAEEPKKDISIYDDDEASEKEVSKPSKKK